MWGLEIELGTSANAEPFWAEPALCLPDPVSLILTVCLCVAACYPSSASLYSGLLSLTCL